MKLTRREMLAGAAAMALSLPAIAQTKATTESTTQPATTQAAKPRIGIIGCGGIANFHAHFLQPFADIAAVCDVDKNHLKDFNEKHAAGKAFATADYRDVLKQDIPMVMICTPDHWHTKIAIDAMRAGKDVYLEKPATLTFDEGRILNRVTRETSRVVQVGTQQRQDEKFLTAIGLCHAGRLGKIKRVLINIGETKRGKDFKKESPPPELDWDMWLGQAPKVDYIKQRCHNDFRWWYEYSGGITTDWGAHHVDIALWAATPDLPAPMTIEPLEVTLPVKFKDGYPAVDNAFNTPTRFNVKCTFANGVEMFIRDDVPGIKNEGLIIEGEKSWVLVSRSQLSGQAVDELKTKPLPERPLLIPPVDTSIEQPHQRHEAEFVRCCRERTMPRSDVWSHHRTLTTCHLANIAMRLGRTIDWDAAAERIMDDEQANSFLSRPQRKGFEVS